MCGRFVITHPTDEMAQLFEARPSNDLPAVPNYNVCPTNRVHVVTSEDGVRRLRGMRWGFLPHWYNSLSDGPLLINARGESVAEKPAFRAASRERRCLIPGSGFYEWTKDDAGKRLPWFIRELNNAVIAFAGIWQDWTRGEDHLTTCAIVTTSANKPMSTIHHRMPVVLKKANWPLWLGEAGKGAATLMRPAGDNLLTSHRVDPAVNSNRASGSDLIRSIAV